MIQANKDPNVLIKEISKHCVHVRLTKVAFDDKDPAGTMTQSSVIQVFSPEEFERMEGLKTGQYKIDWVKVAGFREARVVHDGRLVAEEPEAPASEVANAVVNEVLKAAKEAASKERKRANVRRNLNKAK